MLSAADIVQTSTGSSGTGGIVSSFSVTCSPLTAGNGVILIIANADGNVFPDTPNNNAWLGCGAATNASPVPCINMYSFAPVGGETSFAFTLSTPGDIYCWLLIEVDNLADMASALYPDGTLTLRSVANDTGLGSNNTSSTATTTILTTPFGTPINNAGDEMVISAAANRITSGTPKTVSGVADTTAGQPGTWARVGATIATSRAAGVNMRLDCYAKFAGGVLHQIDATYTFSASVTGSSAVITGFMANFIPPQQVMGRAAPSSGY